jgi:hypothetical protein
MGITQIEDVREEGAGNIHLGQRERESNVWVDERLRNEEDHVHGDLSCDDEWNSALKMEAV